MITVCCFPRFQMESLHDIQCHESRDTMSIGRNLPYIKASVIYMDGIDPFCPIRSQIFLPEITTGFSAEAIHPFSQFSPIEAFSVTVGNLF